MLVTDIVNLSAVEVTIKYHNYQKPFNYYRLKPGVWLYVDTHGAETVSATQIKDLELAYAKGVATRITAVRSSGKLLT